LAILARTSSKRHDRLNTNHSTMLGRAVASTSVRPRIMSAASFFTIRVPSHSGTIFCNARNRSSTSADRSGRWDRGSVGWWGVGMGCGGVGWVGVKILRCTNAVIKAHAAFAPAGGKRIINADERTNLVESASSLIGPTCRQDSTLTCSISAAAHRRDADAPDRRASASCEERHCCGAPFASVREEPSRPVLP